MKALSSRVLWLTVFSAQLLLCAQTHAQRYSSVTFKVDMTHVNDHDGAYLTGGFTGPEGSWRIVPLVRDEGQENVYSYQVDIEPGEHGAYYFLRGNDWSLRETVPKACANAWGVDRSYTIPESHTTYAFEYGSCREIVPAVEGADAQGVVEEVRGDRYPAIVQGCLEIETLFRPHH